MALILYISFVLGSVSVLYFQWLMAKAPTELDPIRISDNPPGKDHDRTSF